MEDMFLSQKTTIFKALAHPVRLAIAENLMEKEFCVCEIAEWFSYDRTTISKHLCILRNAGIIEDRKEGLNVYYSLRLTCLGNLLACLQNTLEQELREQMQTLEQTKKNSTL